MFNNYSNFPQYGGYQQAPTMNQPPVNYAPPPATNKLYVVSVDDAVSRYASPNSVMLYVLQDESAVIEVATDPQGRKTHRVRVLAEPPQREEVKTDDFVRRNEFEEFRAEMRKIYEGGASNV